MTKSDFLSKMPWQINHKSHGLSEREIVIHSSGKINVCYRNPKTNYSSFGTLAQTWQDIFTKLNKGLISEKYNKD